MLRTLAFAAAGLVVGVLITAALRPSAGPWAVGEAPPPTAAASAELLIAADERAMLTRRIESLEGRIGTLADELETLRSSRATPDGAAAALPTVAVPMPAPVSLPIAPDGNGPAAFFGSQVSLGPERNVDLLIEGGFTRERAEWLSRRVDELVLQGMQARYEAERNGEPPSRDDLFDPTLQLRAELGDTEYEQYLRALGRPVEISVLSVIADSPAERAGMRTGDRIVAYAGRRVFDIRELNPLILAGTPGEPVVVEVERDGGRLQLVVPRGPLGISGGIGTPNAATGPITVVPMRSMPPQ